MVEYKERLLAAIAPHTSAILIDPVFGAAPALASGSILGTQGFLVSLEATGYEDSDGDRITNIAKGWSVEKIKRMGASAVKILLYYNPDSSTANRQEKFIESAVEDCTKNDIPLLVEPMTYNILNGPKKGTAEFAKLKPEMVIETARVLCKLGIDVLKAEFPDDPDFEKDEAVMAQHCRELNDAAGIPWVLLSAGVDYETFKLQTTLACSNGASGFLAGRAIWQEAPGLPEKEQDEFLNTVAVRRLEELTEIANSSGTAWEDLYKDRIQAIDIAEGWQVRF
jgi:tagatose 1,6-diphosphate aldolase